MEECGFVLRVSVQQHISVLEKGVRQSVQQSKTACLKLSELKMYDENGNDLTSLKVLLVECPVRADFSLFNAGTFFFFSFFILQSTQ